MPCLLIAAGLLGITAGIKHIYPSPHKCVLHIIHLPSPGYYSLILDFLANYTFILTRVLLPLPQTFLYKSYLNPYRISFHLTRVSFRIESGDVECGIDRLYRQVSNSVTTVHTLGMSMSFQTV